LNSKLLAVVIITGILFSTGSLYLSHAVFADDSWSDIQARQKIAEQRALATYVNHYQFANINNTMRNWDGLTSTTTDETSRGRNIGAQEQVSLQNAVAQFNTIHIDQLANLSDNGYQGLNSTTTDTQGRDRTAMIANATASSLVQANDVLSQLVKIEQNYAGFQAGLTTDTTSTYDRQTQITQNKAEAESQAAALVNKLAKIDQVYLDLTPYVGTTIPYVYKPGSITSEVYQNGGRNITPQEAYALEKAVLIFNEIHQKHITDLQSNYYGLNSVSTDETGRDRNTLLEQAKMTSNDNAMRVYNSYYNGVGLK